MYTIHELYALGPLMLHISDLAIVH